MKAASGPIGGDLSHEFIVLAPTGESEVFYDAAFEEFDWAQAGLSYEDASGLQALFDQVSSTYSATDETHDEARWSEVPRIASAGPRHRGRAHLLFRHQIFGVDGPQGVRPDGSMVYPEMGSYGVGVSRLVGAIIEASHDDNGIVWPEAVAPWKVGLVTMRGDDDALRSRAATTFIAS
jgi:prolyl-tRNA synthetase